MFSSAEEVAQGLNQAGYVTDPTIHQSIYVAARQHKPLLIEGPAGSGKTEVAMAIAKAAQTDCLRLQCYEGIDEEKAIGKFDEALQRLYLETQGKAVDQSWSRLKKDLHSMDFFIAGPLLQSLLYEEKPCVLLIDELDKVSYAFEALLLEVLSCWQMSIPKLGTITARQIPFVVMTSNQERRLGDPLRSRSLYLRFEYPSPEVETAIIQRKCPSQNPETIAGLAVALRSWSLEKPPSIREMIDLSGALDLLGLDHLTPELRDVLLPLLAKTQADRKKLMMKESFACLVQEGERYKREILADRLSA